VAEELVETPLESPYREQPKVQISMTAYAEISSTQNDAPRASKVQENSENKFIKIDNINVKEKLGAGNFGEVYRGDWEGAEVALKKLKSAEDYEEFVKEAGVLKNLNHPNVLRLLGIFIDNSGFQYIVTEFMPKGNLLKVVQSDKSILISDLINMAKQAAAGMTYLESQSIIHRDLALRNLLVTVSATSKYTIKVADFGLSRMSDKEYYVTKSGSFPIKWTAPESLTMCKFSHQSDVWSFGVVLYELFTRGRAPYFNLTNEQAAERVVAGYRLEKPTECPDDIYVLMKMCWEAEPQNRITFHNLVVELSRLNDIYVAAEKLARVNNKQAQQPQQQVQQQPIQPPQQPPQIPQHTAELFLPDNYKFTK